jgi:hypothetical protein
MPRTHSIRDQALLTAALEGLELQRKRLDEQIQEVRSLLGRGRRGRPSTSNNHQGHQGGGRLSAAARRRIAAAQKRRWAEYRKSAASKAG